MGNRASASFSKADFESAARIFRGRGYRAAASNSDVDAIELGLFLSHAKSNFLGGNELADIRRFREIS